MERIGARGDGARGRYSAGRGRPLVVTADGALLDELLSLAEAGGVEVTVAVDALAAEADWASAPLVIVGPDQVADLSRRNLPRRLAVVLVSRSNSAGADQGDDPESPWSGAEALHAEHVVVLPQARSWLAARFAESRPRALRHAAPVVAFVPGSAEADAGALAAALAVTARWRGLSALLIGADPLARAADFSEVTDLAGAVSTRRGAGSLAVLALARGSTAALPPDMVAAALRAARHGRDLVVVDVPQPHDEGARLTLSCADQCYLVVPAEIRACSSANRIAATVRRHCPGVALVVRAVSPRGLRPDEVAEALNLRLAGVLPPEQPGDGGSERRPDPGLRAVVNLSRRLLAESGARARTVAPRPTTNGVAGTDAAANGAASAAIAADGASTMTAAVDR